MLQNTVSRILSTCALVSFMASTALAQGYSGYGGDDSPFSQGGSDGGDDGGSSNNPYSNGGQGGQEGFSFAGLNLPYYRTVLTAHAVLATLAFGLVFPVGGVIIRVASFRGLWWVHGLVQMLGYILYLSAFAIGVWLLTQAPPQLNLPNNAHPIIGIVLFALILFQPILGVVHHIWFKRHARRTVWSYAHIWLGRIVITLGMINGGLGLDLASRMPLAPPRTNAIVGYGVAAGFMWLLYVFSAIVGENRRSRAVTQDTAGARKLRQGRTSGRARRTGGEMALYA